MNPMRRLAKNLILATAVVSAIFIVDLSTAEAATLEKKCPFHTDYIELRYMDFWGKFRDTVMPDPDTPQNNNPPKEMEKPRPSKPKPVNPKPAPPPKPAD
jgi:hypothetical protein